MTKCYTDECENQVSPHQWNGFDLWCKACHIKARYPDGPPSYGQIQATKVRNFQKRVFADGRQHIASMGDAVSNEIRLVEPGDAGKSCHPPVLSSEMSVVGQLESLKTGIDSEYQNGWDDALSEAIKRIRTTEPSADLLLQRFQDGKRLGVIETEDRLRKPVSIKVCAKKVYMFTGGIGEYEQWRDKIAKAVVDSLKAQGVEVVYE